MPGDPPDDSAARSEDEAAEGEPAGTRLSRSAKRLDETPGLVRAAKNVRGLLPGELDLQEALRGPSRLLGRLVADDGTGESASTTRELGLAALQVFQALGETRARGQGKRELSILFTDLVGFSDWALEAGDAAAIELLQAVAEVLEPAIVDRRGEVVKRLGDGLMAVFTDAESAVLAALDAQRGLAEVRVEGHSPQLRAGVHVGQPRKVGRDYLGVDVNIAARVADAARGDQVLVSETARGLLDDERFDFRRKRWFRAKGAPRDLVVYDVSSR